MICVVVVCYKSDDWMGKFLESLASQDFGPYRTKVLLIDNDQMNIGSIFSPAGALHLTYVRATKNLRFGGGANLGLCLASRTDDCSHVLITNPDAWYEQDCLREANRIAVRGHRAVARLVKHPCSENTLNLDYMKACAAQSFKKRGGALPPPPETGKRTEGFDG